MNVVPAPRNWLEDLTVEHGPVDLFGRFFLKADTALRQRGISLSFGTFDELLETNQRNRDSWLALAPTFSREFATFDPATSGCLIGRNSTGDVVLTHATRFYDWQDTNFHEQAENMRLWYDDPDTSKLPGEYCRVTAPSAKSLNGRIAFSGAVWYRPDFRGLGLPLIMSRVIRAYGHARWRSELSVSIMSNKVIGAGMRGKTGHHHQEWAVEWLNSRLANMTFALVWLDQFELVDELSGFLADFDTKVDRGVQLRRA